MVKQEIPVAKSVQVPVVAKSPVQQQIVQSKSPRQTTVQSLGSRSYYLAFSGPNLRTNPVFFHDLDVVKQEIAVAKSPVPQVVAHVAVPAKSTQQVVAQVAVAKSPVVPQVVRKQPVARQQVQVVEVPRKAVNVVRQSNEFVVPHYYNSGVQQPSWAHHYRLLYPTLVHRPYYQHVRYPVRYV